MLQGWRWWEQYASLPLAEATLWSIPRRAARHLETSGDRDMAGDRMLRSRTSHSIVLPFQQSG